MKVLHLGCGEGHIEGTINCDIRALPGVDVVCDVRKLPFRNEEVDEVANKNLIEHFGRHEIAGLLKEWARVLKVDGLMTLETVDMGRTMDKWKELPEENLLDAVLGAQTYPENFHKMLFTKEILERFLIEAGFKILNVEQFENREIPRIRVTAQKLCDASIKTEVHKEADK